MRVFLTGASGWIGSAVIGELRVAGHEVVGLARSEASAVRIEASGASAVRGDLGDLDVLRREADRADGVVHCGYLHDFSRMGDAALLDRGAIEAFADVLAWTGKPLVVTSGVGLVRPGHVVTERDRHVLGSGGHPRADNAEIALALAERGVRVSVVRPAPTVHGDGDHGFVPFLIGVARRAGVAGYVGDGTNRWCAVHRFDCASLYKRALEDAPAGSVLHAVAEQGIPTREIAEAIGRGLGLPVRSIEPGDAAAHFEWMAMFWSADIPASSDLTREALGWQPTHPGLIADLEAGHYFA